MGMILRPRRAFLVTFLAVFSGYIVCGIEFAYAGPAAPTYGYAHGVVIGARDPENNLRITVRDGIAEDLLLLVGLAPDPSGHYLTIGITSWINDVVQLVPLTTSPVNLLNVSLNPIFQYLQIPMGTPVYVQVITPSGKFSKGLETHAN